MKSGLFLMAGLALMSAFTACSNDDEMKAVAQAEGTPLVVQSVGVAEVNTKAGIRATAFSGSEQIGLFIYAGAKGSMTGDYNTDNSAIPTVNVPYGRNAVGGEWSAAQPIILSSTNGVVYGYYPYNSDDAYKTPTAIPVTLAADQGSGQSDGLADNGQTDYMYAVATENVSNSSATISTLTMKHALAMLTFAFKQSDQVNDKYPGEGKVSQIILKNKSGKSVVKTGAATMDIYSGVITGGSDVVDSDPASITVSPNPGKSLLDVTTSLEGTTDDYPFLPRMLVYPNGGVAGDDAELLITVDSRQYTVPVPALESTTGWLAGNNYTYTLMLKGTDLVISNVAISEWVPKEGGSGVIK